MLTWWNYRIPWDAPVANGELSSGFIVPIKGSQGATSWVFEHERCWKATFFQSMLENIWSAKLEISNKYPLVNQHNYGKSPFLMGKFTISMAISTSMEFQAHGCQMSDDPLELCDATGMIPAGPPYFRDELAMNGLVNDCHSASVSQSRTILPWDKSHHIHCIYPLVMTNIAMV
jgi:hypothetical protein